MRRASLFAAREKCVLDCPDEIAKRVRHARDDVFFVYVRS